MATAPGCRDGAVAVEPEVQHGDEDGESEGRPRRGDDTAGAARCGSCGGGCAACRGAGRNAPRRVAGRPARGCGGGRVGAADPRQHPEPRQLRLRGPAQHRRLVREGVLAIPAPRVPGLRRRPDRAAGVERPAGVHGPVAEESREPAGAAGAPSALLLGHRGLQRPPDLRGARRDARSRPFRAAGGHHHQRRQLRRTRRRAAAVQSRHRLRRTGLPGRGVRHRRGGGAAAGRPAADSGPDAEPHQVPRVRPVERPGLVSAADGHARGRLAGAHRRGRRTARLRGASHPRLACRLGPAAPGPGRR